jgi:hypothetical protein
MLKQVVRIVTIILWTVNADFWMLFTFLHILKQYSFADILTHPIADGWRQFPRRSETNRTEEMTTLIAIATK